MLLLIEKKDYLVAQKKLKYQKKIFDTSIQKRGNKCAFKE